MTQISIITDRDAFGPPPVSAGYKVDISRGERIGRVSSEWFSRPDDERYLSLSALYAAVRARADRATARTVETRALRVEASRDNAERLALIVPGREEPIAPTHWSFGQMCSLVGAPAGYMRQLPAPLAGINMQHGLLSHRAELVKTLEADDGRIELRAVTGPDYGRIWDHELVAAVMKIAGDGTGDTRWKVPGLLDWSTMTHNPFVEVTKDTTTLYASRSRCLPLPGRRRPSDRGRPPAQRRPRPLLPRLLLLEQRGGLQDARHGVLLSPRRLHEPQHLGRRGLRGDHDPPQQVRRHRFAHQAAPALERFATSSPAPFLAGIRAAREQIVARKDEDRESFLRKRGFSRPETEKIIATVLEEEGRPPESIFDFVQGITALARAKPHQDARLELEGKAAKLLSSVR